MALNAKQQTRLNYLKKNRPNDPEVKKLQRMASQGGVAAPAGPAPAPAPLPPAPEAPKTSPGAVSNLGNYAAAGAANEFIQKGPLDVSGQPQIFNTGGIMGDTRQLSDTIYKDATRDYAQARQDELVQTEQTLMQRGIPYNPDPNSLWGKSMEQINKRYERMDQQARAAADQVGFQNQAQLTNANTGANQAFVQGAISAYQAPADAAIGLSGIYQGNQQVQNQTRLTPAQVAALNRSNRGGGRPSGGGGGGDQLFGEAP